MSRCAECGAAFVPAKHFHHLCPSCSRRKFAGVLPPSAGVVLDVETARGALRLAHPDRHPAEREEQATKITQALNAALDDARALGRA